MALSHNRSSNARWTVRPARSWERRYLAALVTADGAIWVLVSLIAEIIAFGRLDPTLLVASSPLPYLAVVFLLAVIWLVALGTAGAYDRQKVGLGSDEYRSVINAAVRFLAILAVLDFALHTQLARSFVLIAWPSATIISLLLHWAARRWLYHQRLAGRRLQRTVLVGRSSRVAEISRHFSRAPHTGVSVVGACTEGPHSGLSNLIDARGDILATLGEREYGLSPDDIVMALDATRASLVAVVDTVLLADGSLRPLACELEKRHAELIVVPTLTNITGPRVVVHQVGGLPLFHIAKPALTGLTFYLKGIVERILCALLLVLLAPAILAIATGLWLTSGRPIIFRQVRVGQHGKLFTLYKFRTMREGAEQQLSFLADRNETDGPLFKMSDDPRVTRFGALLRRWSLDEIPQFWNVLRGDMALVGPRPPLTPEVRDSARTL